MVGLLALCASTVFPTDMAERLPRSWQRAAPSPSATPSWPPT
jgi:hypothetical protein